MTLAGLPPWEALHLADVGGVAVRPLVKGDGDAVAWIVNDPNLAYTPGAYTAEAVEEWIDDQAQRWNDDLEDRSLLLAAMHESKVVGFMSARFQMELRDLTGDELVPTIEWSAYRHSSARGFGVVSRSIGLVEPVLVEHVGLQQVIAVTDASNLEAQASVQGYLGPIDPSSDPLVYWRRVNASGQPASNEAADPT